MAIGGAVSCSEEDVFFAMLCVLAVESTVVGCVGFWFVGFIGGALGNLDCNDEYSWEKVVAGVIWEVKEMEWV